MEATYDDLEEDGCFDKEEADTLTPEERHINSLSNNGVCVKLPDGTKEPVTIDFYRRVVAQCIKGNYNAVTYEIELPGIEGEFMIAIHRDGHVDSGTTERICQILDR